MRRKIQLVCSSDELICNFGENKLRCSSNRLKGMEEITQIRISAKKNERKKSRGGEGATFFASSVSAIVAYLNSLDVNYTSGNNVCVLSRVRPEETVSVGRLC